MKYSILEKDLGVPIKKCFQLLLKNTGLKKTGQHLITRIILLKRKLSECMLLLDTRTAESIGLKFVVKIPHNLEL